MYIKNILRPLYNIFIKIIYSNNVSQSLIDTDLSPRTVLKYFFFQRILRFNSHVPWPVHFTTQVICPEKIERGSRFPGFSICCFIDGRNGIELGSNVWIGPRVTLISQDHNNEDFSTYKNEPPIIIKENCLLTANCVLLPGVTLGPHTIVAAGAVVSKSFPEGNQILAGVPARVVKKITPNNEIKKRGTYV